MKKYIIIGGGVAGLTAAINLARKNNSVTVLEQKDKILKKLLLTGSGKCNFWNKNQDIKFYHSESDNLKNIVTEKNLNNTFSFIKSLNFLMHEKDGYFYPKTNQASTVLNALLITARLNNVELITNFNINEIKKKEDKFLIYGNNTCLKGDAVVIATGSNATAQSMASEGYTWAKDFGHTVIEVLPSLVQLKSTGFFLQNWAGVRSGAKVKLYINNTLEQEQTGEIQLTDYGVSGICVMQLSNLAVKALNKNQQVFLKINFLKEYDFDSLNILLDTYDKRLKIIEVLECLLNKKLANVILEVSKINKDTKLKDLNLDKKTVLINNIVEFNLPILGYNDITQAQTVSGGVSLDEINYKNMESTLVKDLYFAGEILDCNGDCGGYNLSFAFLTGLLVGDGND